MENTGQLKTLIEPLLTECGVKLAELKWINGSDHTLQIAIMHEDGTMDLDTCAEVSDRISKLLDETDAVKTAYTLEVCSPGAEREISDINELSHLDHPYVYLRLSEPIKKMIEFTGTVKSFENQVITLEYRDKQATRTAEIQAENVEFIRLAVKF